ncbi:splicing factor ESS-2 homolog [Bactrocera tryoni]|uniref:splicing factor ESS-2 homolog n=1 Tax=Bactrocera tryoni TaxID=59916 RepID=UPI001A97E11F|nr:splicing factor ESS-2 homolog [Bactrocera tryoni]
MSEPSTPNTPGSQALVKLKERDKGLQDFKVPLSGAVRKKTKQKILTEEMYIEELSKIIQRDFFPHLDKLRAQNDYLDAMERKDYAQMEAIRAKYSGRRPTDRSSMSPATFETPASANGIVTPRHDSNDVSDTPKSTLSISSKTSRIDVGIKSISDKHSLDSFLQHYTSEDNYSFQEIIDTADEKLRQKFAVLYNEEKLSADKLARALTLPSIEKQFEEPDPLRKIETWSYTNKNSIMYIPDGVDLTERERVEAAKRREIIKHNATRLNSNPFAETANQKANSELVKSQSQALMNKIGLDGNVITPGNESEGPQVRGFSLVKTPSPRPGEAFSPLMTWGEIEGTPFRLDGSDTPVRPNVGPAFTITENSRRENIALALAEKVGEKMRAQKQRAADTARKNINSPFIRSNMERLASMSPAARRLATSKLGLNTTPLMPTPQRTPGKVMHRAAPMPKARKTPSGSAGTNSAPSTPKQISSGKSTLTDDLLKIPTKRLRASDFF